MQYDKKHQIATELQQTLQHVKRLQGILPICVKCKKIRDDKGYWNSRKTQVVKSLIKFQKILNIPAVQLVNKSGICKLVSNNNLKIMIISADHWLSLLP